MFLRAMLLAFVMTACSAIAQEVWIGRPTVGDYIRRDLERLVNAQQELARSTAQFKAQIAQARSDVAAAKASDQKRKAEERLAGLLFQKELYYAMPQIVEGDSGLKRGRAIRQLGGGDIDDGIPSGAQQEFQQWIASIRRLLGARNNQELLFVTDKQKFLKAIDGSMPQYQAYVNARDGAVGKDARARVEAGVKTQERSAAIAKAQSLDGSAVLHKKDVVVFHSGAYRVDLAAKNPQLRQLFAQLRDVPHYVLNCVYGPMGTPDQPVRYATYTFWYQELPANIDEIVAADTTGALLLGRSTLDACPATSKAAVALRQQNMRQSSATLPSSDGAREPNPGSAVPAPTEMQPGHSPARRTERVDGTSHQEENRRRRCEQLQNRIAAQRAEAERLQEPHRSNRLRRLESTPAASACN